MPQAQFEFDPELTAVANAIAQDTLINDQILPIVRVEQESFSYLELPRGEMFTIPETLIGQRGEPNEVTFHGKKQTGSVEGHALKSVIPTRMQEQAPRYYNPRARAATGTRDLLQLGVEKNMADVVFDPDNYDANHKETLAGTGQWSHEESDPIRYMLRIFDNLMVRPNVGVIGRQVATELTLHPKIVRAKNGNEGGEGTVNLSFVASQLGLRKLLVGDAWFNAKNLGQDVSFSRVWGKHAAFLHESNVTFIRGDGAVSILSWGVTFMWPINGQRYGTFTWRDPNPGVSGAETVKVSTQYTHKVIAPDFGYLFLNAVA